MWRKTSGAPSAGETNPNPFSGLNHLMRPLSSVPPCWPWSVILITLIFDSIVGAPGSAHCPRSARMLECQLEAWASHPRKARPGAPPRIARSPLLARLRDVPRWVNTRVLAMPKRRCPNNLIVSPEREQPVVGAMMAVSAAPLRRMPWAAISLAVAVLSFLKPGSSATAGQYDDARAEHPA